MAAAVTVKRRNSSTLLLLCVAAALILAAADGRRDQDAEHHNKDQDLVFQACWNTSQIDLPSETCERLLRSDKRSATAKETRDLLLIAIDLVDRAATELDAKLEQHQGAVVQLCRLCSSLVARMAPMCRGEVQEYKPGDKSNDFVLYTTTIDLRYAAQGCESYMLQLPDDDAVKKAIGKVADDANDLGDLLRAMVIQMVPHDISDPPQA